MYERRENIIYYDQKWPGCRLILDPEQVEKWARWRAGGWAFDYSHEEFSHLRCEIEEDPVSKYHFLLNFQHSQSMKETVDSLPSRIHVPRTGTNTFRVPLYDLMPTLDLLSAHTNYDVMVANIVYELYDKVVQEDELIKSLAEITDDDKKEIARIKEVYEKSETINHEAITPFKFQFAGIAMMLYIYGVAAQMKPGFIKAREKQRPLSTMTSHKEDDIQLSLLVEKYINS